MTSQSYASFEDVYKTAYSHGLEAIYALENVDLKTVRRISEEAQKPAAPIIHTPFLAEEQSDQLEFDFGEEYQKGIDSFVLDEPIQVLGLSRHAEKCLCEHGKTLLRHLHGANLKGFVFLKGMGQGHIDEIQKKLALYVSEHTLYHCHFVDFDSWLRTLTAALNQKKMHVLLEKFQLSESLTLSPAESVEVRRLTLEKRREWIQEIMPELKSQKQVLQGISKIANVFIKPWMRRRLGIATKQELEERLQNCGREPSKVPLILEFLSAIYFEGEFLFKNYFIMSDESLFFVDRSTQSLYSLIVDKALTYFYKEGICYKMGELKLFLMREFAKNWQGFPEGFIEKTLRLSPQFSVRKSENNHLMVRLTPAYKNKFVF